jgi:hypothetical protein
MLMMRAPLGFHKTTKGPELSRRPSWWCYVAPMSEKSLKALVDEMFREFRRQHGDVKKRLAAQHAQGLPYSKDDVARLVELNSMINPLERLRQALKHAVAPNPDDVETLLKNLNDEVKNLKDEAGDLPSDDEG